MRIAIISAYSEELSYFANLTSSNHKEYADAHAYEYLLYTEGFDKERPYSWSKINFIKKNIYKYDFIMWLDSDTLFMRFDIKLEDIIIQYSEYDVIMGEEDFGFRKNASAGVFIVKSSKKTIDFLNLVYEQEQFINHEWWEQQAIIFLLAKYDLNYVKLIDARIFNSMIINNSYYNGDFICHFAGLHHTIYYRRKLLIPEYFKYVNKNIKVDDFDVIFLSYNESNADKNFNRLKSICPRAKRVSGVKGLIESLEVSINSACTEFFYLVDGDNYVLDNFKFTFNPYTFRKNTYLWKSKNSFNNLEYGNGSIKLFNRNAILTLVKQLLNGVEHLEYSNPWTSSLKWTDK